MIGPITKVVAVLLALYGGAVSAQGVLLPPEQTGKIDRYDSVRQVLYIGGQEYVLTGQAAQVAAEVYAAKGYSGLSGRNAAFETGEPVNGKPSIDVLMLPTPPHRRD